MNHEMTLETGKVCKLLRIRRNMIPNYFVLVFPIAQGQPNSAELTQMLQLGTEHAQRLALQSTNDAEAFTILYSGYSARREKGWHVHIVLLGSRWKKAWLYLVLSGKNIAPALGLRKDDAPRFVL